MHEFLEIQDGGKTPRPAGVAPHYWVAELTSFSARRLAVPEPGARTHREDRPAARRRTATPYRNHVVPYEPRNPMEPTAAGGVSAASAQRPPVLAIHAWTRNNGARDHSVGRTVGSGTRPHRQLGQNRALRYELRVHPGGYAGASAGATHGPGGWDAEQHDVVVRRRTPEGHGLQACTDGGCRPLDRAEMLPVRRLCRRRAHGWAAVTVPYAGCAGYAGADGYRSIRTVLAGVSVTSRIWPARPWAAMRPNACSNSACWVARLMSPGAMFTHTNPG